MERPFDLAEELTKQPHLQLAGGLDALRSQLPDSHYAFYDYGAGLIIQSGASPCLAGDGEDPKPAAYVLLNHLLKPIRYETVGSLHGGSHDGEARLDVEDSELAAWRA